MFCASNDFFKHIDSDRIILNGEKTLDKWMKKTQMTVLHRLGQECPCSLYLFFKFFSLFPSPSSLPLAAGKDGPVHPARFPKLL